MGLKVPLDQLIVELKTQPYTLLSILVLFFLVGWGLKTHAESDTVAEAKRELRAEITEATAKIAGNGRKIDRVLLLQFAEAIRGQQRQICSTEDEAIRTTLQTTLDNLQAEYVAISGSYYPVSPCKV